MSTTHVTSEGRFRQHAESHTRYAESGTTDADSASDAAESILLGQSGEVRRLRAQIQRIAPYFRIALIRGETGSGKQMVARALHARSPGARGPFVMAHAYDMGEPGGGGTRAGATLLDFARGGTLYLGGAGELSFAQQEMLVRFLRSCSDGRTTGVRILASSGRDLHALAAMGQFRHDLCAQLSAVEIVVPPLRQRVEDIPILAAWLLRRLAEGSGQAPKIVAEAAMAQLQDRAWPGNLREMEREIAQAAELAEGGMIEPRHLAALAEPESANPGSVAAQKMERLHDVMMQHVLEVLARCSGNKVRAAEALGISRSTLYRMLGTRAAMGGRP